MAAWSAFIAACSETGRLNVVALNVGERDGLERGHVLSLFRNRGTAEYRGEAGKESFQLAGEALRRGVRVPCVRARLVRAGDGIRRPGDDRRRGAQALSAVRLGPETCCLMAHRVRP